MKGTRVGYKQQENSKRVRVGEDGFLSATNTSTCIPASAAEAATGPAAHDEERMQKRSRRSLATRVPFPLKRSCTSHHGLPYTLTDSYYHTSLSACVFARSTHPRRHTHMHAQLHGHSSSLITMPVAGGFRGERETQFPD